MWLGAGSSTRGEHLRVRLKLYFCNHLVQIMLLCLIWKVFESSFTWYIVDCSALRGYRVTDQNEEGCLQTPAGSHCARQKAKQSWFDVKTGVASAFRLSLSCFLELGKLSYLIWKRTFRATCWYENQDHCPTDRYFMIIFRSLAGVCQHLYLFNLSLCNSLEQRRLPYLLIARRS